MRGWEEEGEGRTIGREEKRRTYCVCEAKKGESTPPSIILFIPLGKSTNALIFSGYPVTGMAKKCNLGVRNTIKDLLRYLQLLCGIIYQNLSEIVAI